LFSESDAWRRGRAITQLLILIIIGSTSSLLADSTAYIGALVMPVSGPVIEDGVLVVRDGKIESVGARSDVVIPSGATQIDC